MEYAEALLTAPDLWGMVGGDIGMRTKSGKRRGREGGGGGEEKGEKKGEEGEKVKVKVEKTIKSSKHEEGNGKEERNG